MNEFQSIWSGASNKRSSNSEPATVKAARTISEKALRHPLRDREKNRAGELVHYAFGTLNGAAYGALAEVSPLARACAGTLFGAALFVVADEILVPALGWSKSPAKYPWTTHVYGFASHLVYGATTDGVRRMVLGAL